MTPDQQIVVQGSGYDIAAVEAALLEYPGIQDGAVLARMSTNSKTDLIAYVVPSFAFDEGQLDAYLRSKLPNEMVPSAYVQVSRIPYTIDGCVDERDLCQLPVIDDALIGQCEQRLRETLGIHNVTVVSQIATEDVLRWHVAELLPSWRSTASNPAASSGAGPQPNGREKTSDRLSISHGEELYEETLENLSDALARAARQAPGYGVVYHQPDGSDAQQSYPELLADAERILGGLRMLGLGPQDKVIFQFDRAQDFIPAFWACMLGGFVPVPLAVAPSYTSENSAFSKFRNAWLMLEHPIVLTARQLAPALRSSPEMKNLRVCDLDDLRGEMRDHEWHRSEPDDLALLLLTSGSTGCPKAVMLSQRNILARCVGTKQLDGFSHDDISLNFMPLDHVGGIVMFHVRDVYLFCRQIHVPADMILSNPLKWLDLIEEYRATITWAPNFAFGLVNDRVSEVTSRQWDLSSMRFILNGGEAIVARTARRFLELLAPHGLPQTSMHPAWGMSETSSGVTSSHFFTLDSTHDSDSFVEVGGPIPGVSLRIVDHQGEIVSESTVGLLQVKGTTVTAGYYQNSEANAEAFTKDGWFNTGDLAILCNGRLTITGRVKDVIIVNGINYFSHEIESIVEQVEGVEISFTAACGVRSAASDTDQLAIFFCPKFNNPVQLTGLLQEIRSAVVRNVGITPEFLVPLRHGDIPKTEIGKIKRSELKQRFEVGEFSEVIKDVESRLGINTLPAWFFRTVWRRKNKRGRETGLPPDGSYVVFKDSSGLGESLCQVLRTQGQTCIAVQVGPEFAKLNQDSYQIDPRNPADYDQLFTSMGERGVHPDWILHLWTYGPAPVDARTQTELEEGLCHGPFSLLYLVQACGKSNEAQQQTWLYVISSHAALVSPDDRTASERAAIQGLFKTVPQELPWMRTVRIDLPPDSVDVNTATVLNELGSASDSEVAYRDGLRFVPRLEQIDVAKSKQQPLPLKRGGLYLISGGLGGIGAKIARYLLENWDAKLLLIGRTPLRRESGAAGTTMKDVIEEKERVLEGLRQLGQVKYEACDIADLTELRLRVEQTEAEWGRRVDGVIHLAGAYDEKLILEETREHFAATLRPKVFGTLSLHRLLKDHSPGSLFVSFSSTNGFCGGFNSSAYAAANSFLDHYSSHLNRDNIRNHVFAWTMWDEVGMSRGYEMKDFTRTRGFHLINQEQGLLSFFLGLTQRSEQILIGLDARHPEICGRLHKSSRPLQKLVGIASPDVGQCANHSSDVVTIQDRFGTEATCTVVRGDLHETTSPDRRGYAESQINSPLTPSTDLERRLAEIWKEVLRVSHVSVHDSFFELGGNSLRATQFLARVRHAFNIDLPMRSLFAAPTLAELSKLLSASLQESSDENDSNHVLSELESMSDEEAERLLSAEPYDS